MGGGELGGGELGGSLEHPRQCGGAPSGWASPWGCRAGQSRQARPGEAQGAGLREGGRWPRPKRVRGWGFGVRGRVRTLIPWHIDPAAVPPPQSPAPPPPPSRIPNTTPPFCPTLVRVRARARVRARVRVRVRVRVWVGARARARARARVRARALPSNLGVHGGGLLLVARL